MSTGGIKYSAFSGWFDPPGDPSPALEGELECDVAIIGGGYTGMAAALRLAERGTDVILLQSAFCGWGASSRNAGHLTPTIAGNPRPPRPQAIVPSPRAARRLAATSSARSRWARGTRGLAHLQRVIDLARRISVVEGRRDQPGPEAGEVVDDQIDPVRHQRGDAIARLQVEPAIAPRQRCARPVELAPAQRALG